jgi:DNA-binding transcriptional LysR family regulator
MNTSNGLAYQPCETRMCGSVERGGVAELTLTGLRVVHEVASTGSFTAAADALNYTQSAVSRQIASVEAAVGATLFQRSARGVQPTAAGVALARRAATVLTQLDAAVQEVAALRDQMVGRLAIGTFPSAASVLVPRAIARLAFDHPGLVVSLEEAGTPVLMRQLAAGRLDVAVIGVGEGLPAYNAPGIRQELLVANDLRVAVAATHRLAGRATVRALELADEAWVVGKGRKGDPQFGAWPTLTDPRIVHQVRDWATRLGLVAAGVGVSLIPGVAAASIPLGVRVLQVDDQLWSGRATVAMTNEPGSLQAAAAVAILKGEARALDLRSR